MKIGILSVSSKLYSTRRLKEAAQLRGHSVRVLAPQQFSILVDQGNPQLLFRGKPISRYDAIIPRIGATKSDFENSVVRQFEQMAVYTLTPSHGISVARDKLRGMQVLSRHNLGIPTTACVFQASDVLPAIDHVGTPPVIIKLLQGTHGAGVMLAESRELAGAIVGALKVANQNVLIQNFVSESRGKDIRAFVVGNEVVAAMRRTAQGNEFRSNVHLGGTSEAVQLDEAYTHAAIHAAHIFGLRVAGVDLLEGKDGPLIAEVNASPGLEGIESSTGIDIADKIIAYLEDQISFPDIDLHERLALGKGYSVAEIPVSKSSELAGKRLAETALLQHEVMVLTVIRNKLSIPAPNSEFQVMQGDTLVCFGKQLALRSFLPESKSGKNGAKRTSKK